MLRSVVRLSVLFILLFTPLLAVEAQEDTILRVVWMTSPSNPPAYNTLLEQYAADFEEAHPGITVEYTFVDWSEGREKILEMVEAGNPPDLALIGARWVPEFVSQGLIEPLDRFLTRTFRRQFVPAIIDEGAIYQGRTFGLPAATSTRALFYNEDILEQAGITEPPQTWEELLAAGKTINEQLGDQGIYGFGLQGGGGLETNTYFYYFVWGNGGDLYNASRTSSALNSPEAVEALTFLQQMIEENATQPNPTDVAYERRRGLEDLFQQGKLAMMISGPWFIGRLRSEAPDLNFGLAPIPYNTTPATYGVIDTVVMFSTSQHKDETWQFMEFMYAQERRLTFARVAGVLPEMTAVAEDPVFAGDPDYAVFLSLLPDARFELLHIQSEAISQAAIAAVQSVYKGEAEPQAALDQAAAEINELLSASVAGW